MDILFWLGTTIVGAVIGFVVREILQWIKDFREERKNSIKGDYKTVTVGSAFRGPGAPTGPINRKLKLGQRGKRVMAVETGPDESNVRWEISGEVNGEYLVGTYKQTEPPSVVDRGAFHLERDPHDPKTWRGLWVGWNPDTRHLTQGEYTWNRE